MYSFGYGKLVLNCKCQKLLHLKQMGFIMKPKYTKVIDSIFAMMTSMLRQNKITLKIQGTRFTSLWSAVIKLQKFEFNFLLVG